MAEFDISFKALAERLPRLVVILFGHGRIGTAAVVQPIDRELAVPLKAVDQAFVIEFDGRRWVVHFEAEVGLSAADRKAIVKRSNLLDAKYDLPIWTTIILMSPRRGPAKPPKTLMYRDGSRTVTVRPRYVKLWKVSAKRFLDAGVTALPWVAATKATRAQIGNAIERIMAIEDRELREQLSAEMTALSYLQYDEDVTGSIRERLGMVTSKQIIDATPLGRELRNYGRREGRKQGIREGRKEGREEGRQEGREEGRQEGRQEGREEGRQKLIGVLELTLQSRAPSAGRLDWLKDIRDMDLLERIFREVLAAPDARAVRDVLSRHRASVQATR